MTNRASAVVMSLLTLVVSMTILLCWGSRGGSVDRVSPPDRGCDAREGRSSHPYGKIEWPVHLSMDLLGETEAEAFGTIVVSAFSTIPLGAGVLTLHIPEIAGEPNRTEVLWTGAPSGAIAETVTYPLGRLPVGQYRFVAIIEFASEGNDAPETAVSQCLYLDVRPTTILSSNVSFEQIKRVELRRELERRILTALQPRFAAASEDTVTRELAKLEAADPGFMDRAIEAMIATDPDMARGVMEVNERRASAAQGSGTITQCN